MRLLLSVCVFVSIAAVFVSGRSIENGQGKANKYNLNISRKPCIANGREGICVYNQECHRKKGEVLGTCLDGFIFGACCNLKDVEDKVDVEDQAESSSKETDPLGILLKIDKLLGSWNKTAIILPDGTIKDIHTVDLNNEIKDTENVKVATDSSAVKDTNEVKDTSDVAQAISNDINETSSASVEITTESPTPTKIEVDHGNIENMMNSIFDNVIQQFDNKLPNLLNELSADPDEEDEDVETSTSPVVPSTSPELSSTSESTSPSDDIISAGTTTAVPIDSAPALSEDTSTSANAEVEVASVSEASEPAVVTNSPATEQGAVIDTKDAAVTTTTEPSTTTTTEEAPPAPSIAEDVITTTTTTTSTTTELASTAAADVTTTTTTSTSTVTWDYRTDCGVRPIRGEGRIVGGTKSKFGDWPWQVLVKESTLLGLFTKNKCGGVLISNKHVLTAAHCQPGFLASLVVELGEFDISGATEFMPTRQAKVKRVVVHKDYQAPTFENDIAILELESDVSREPHIVPICMPVATDLPFEGKPAIVTGWGRLEYGGNVPSILHQVSVPIIENEKCQNMFTRSGHKKIVRESFLCAGYDEGKKDSCEGDSGGPLMMQRDDRRWVLAGTVSHGIKCAYPDLPGVYMRMSFYKPWIEKVTGITFDV